MILHTTYDLVRNDEVFLLDITFRAMCWKDEEEVEIDELHFAGLPFDTTDEETSLILDHLFAVLPELIEDYKAAEADYRYEERRDRDL